MQVLDYYNIAVKKAIELIFPRYQGRPGGNCGGAGRSAVGSLVGGALLEQLQHRAHRAPGRGHLPPVDRSLRARASERAPPGAAHVRVDPARAHGVHPNALSRDFARTLAL